MKTKLFACLAGCTLATAPFCPAQPLTLRTLAGTPAPGATNGFGSNARFTYPQAVTADTDGNVYVADTENSTIRRITPDGFASTLTGLAGSFGMKDGSSVDARFYGPQGIAAGNSGQIYVIDTANHSIRQVNAEGTVTALAGTPGSFNSFDGAGPNAQFYHPQGAALGPDGNLYVADTWNHTIRKVTPAGGVVTVAGMAGNFGSADGTNSKARFYRPAAVAVDDATNVFVADGFNHTIRKISPTGKVTTIAGLAGVWGSTDGTDSAARFYLPDGLCVMANGDLLVADSGNQLLRRVSVVGTNWVVSTVAGLAGLAGSSNGTGATAQLAFPAGLGVDSQGYVYVADAGNNTIRTTRVVPPTLQSLPFGNQFVLSWPTSAEGFLLEQSSALGDAASWQPVSDGIVSQGDNFVRTNNLANTAFYRLRFSVSQ